MKETVKRPRALMHNDWTSRLPDDLLIHVLSFLTTKEAVQTCILSQRWRRLWANLPILKFDVKEFEVDDSHGGSHEALRKSITKFDRFVDGVVKNLHSTHLDRVYYVHDTKLTYFYQVPMMSLHYVALLMPQLIDISIAGVKSLQLPNSFFSCATLQHLKIKLHQVKKTTVLPASVYLPSLKVFYISGAELHDNFAQMFLVGCPSLETLHLCYSELYFSTISSNLLKELAIIECRQYEPMQISCPSLFTLYIHSRHRGAAISLKNMQSLRRAAMGLSSTTQYVGGGDVSVLNFLSALSNAAQLTALSFHVNNPERKVQLERGILNCRNFNNLKELFIIMGAISFDFNLVASLLKISPNVKKLTLTLDVSQLAIHEEHMKEVLRNVLYKHKFIETVKIRDRGFRELPQVLIKTVMKALNTYIKQIGHVIIE